MSDADGNIIPWVEDDQGEGIKDFLDHCNKSKPEWKSCDTELIESLIEKVESLDRKISLIFAGHILINGQFIKATKLLNTKP